MMKDDQEIGFTNERLEALRQEVEDLKQDPKFQRLSKAFRETLAHRTGVSNFTDAGSEIKGALPIPLKHLLSKVDFSKPENVEKLSSISVPLGSILASAGVENVRELVGRDTLDVHLDKLPVEVDFEGLVFEPDSFYANLYSYRFW